RPVRDRANGCRSARGGACRSTPPRPDRLRTSWPRWPGWTMRAEPEVSAYLEAARGWDLDRAQAAHRAMRRAWAVAALACAVAAIAVGAVAVLTPLKTVQPYVIRVDNATGVVDVVPALRGAISESEAVTRYLVTQYVTARGRYVTAIAETDYAKVCAYIPPPKIQTWVDTLDVIDPA